MRHDGKVRTGIFSSFGKCGLANVNLGAFKTGTLQRPMIETCSEVDTGSELWILLKRLWTVLGF